MNVKFCSSDLATIVTEYTHCRAWLLAALAHGDGRIREDTLLRGLLKGDYQLWRTANAAGVTQIDANEHTRTLFIFLAGGDLREIEHVAGPVVEDWARSQGCTSIVLSGRRGWERELRTLGYAYSTTNLIKRL
ncbi:hypothetical protein [Methylobacterium sp. NFXW15]|uniref:hypothetical protein n=1 Tax=Methylobacterium sp. NFXW15 TaxID=2819512 RepID=UPI003CEDCD6A